MARLLDYDGALGILELVERSLEVDPNLVEARVFRPSSCSSRRTTRRRPGEADSAREERRLAARAIRPRRGALPAGRPARYEEARKRALALVPRNAELYNRLAEPSARNRLYPRGGRLRPSRPWPSTRARGAGWACSASTSSALGQIEEGRTNLEASFKGDPYNVWIKNTLDLLDTFPKYRETQTAHFQLLVHGKESDCSRPTRRSWPKRPTAAGRALRLSARRAPIRVEVYPSHGDFSVRTVGLAGLGALGVCFGPCSPSTRRPRARSGTSTGARPSGTRSPTPFTLGRRRQDPALVRRRAVRPRGAAGTARLGGRRHLEFLRALKAGKLLPLATSTTASPGPPARAGRDLVLPGLAGRRMDRGASAASRPSWISSPPIANGRDHRRRPSPVCWARRSDFDRLLRAPAAFRDSAESPAVALPASLARPSSSSRSARREPCSRLISRRSSRRRCLPRARPRRVPRVRGGGHPLLAPRPIYKEQGAPTSRGALARLTAINESHYQANLELARRREEKGDTAGAGAALDRALYIWPFEPGLHQRLAALNTAAGGPAGWCGRGDRWWPSSPWTGRRPCTSSPSPWSKRGTRPQARREVLRALELAPRSSARRSCCCACTGETRHGTAGA